MANLVEYKVRSNYVKERIQGSHFENQRSRDYILDLLFLEDFIMGEVGGFGGGLKANHLKDKYRKEYDAICQELRPDCLKREKEDEAAFKKEMDELSRQVKRMEKEAYQAQKEMWKKYGGIVDDE